MEYIRPCRLERNSITINYNFCFKISKFNKSAGWNKDMQVGKFLKFNKVCSTTIREIKVSEKASKLEFVNSCMNFSYHDLQCSQRILNEINIQ